MVGGDVGSGSNVPAAALILVVVGCMIVLELVMIVEILMLEVMLVVVVMFLLLSHTSISNSSNRFYDSIEVSSDSRDIDVDVGDDASGVVVMLLLLLSY
ncbi:hypothetical protein M0802_012832 [Mischocyttarus mexicanus]|nr:hypothetical protein M0802_012835 [Mischocyttarus mexicanus]KAI4485048.1 hypothetical protein M0802_012832 [Mischocyttarus mexicanus]